MKKIDIYTDQIFHNFFVNRLYKVAILRNNLFGSGNQVNSGCVLYIGNGISIGENVSIAANCVLAPTNHNFEDAKVIIQRQGFKKSKGGIRIGNDVWIGSLTSVLDGSTLGNGCVVGASSLVRGNLDEFGVSVGNPLRKINSRTA